MSLILSIQSETTLPELTQLRGGSLALTLYNLGYLMLAIVMAFAAAVLVWWHPAWYTFALALVVIPSRQHALLNVSHECMHGTFLRDKKANEWVGVIASALVGSRFRASRAHHFAHHRYVGTVADPDHDLHAGDGQETRRDLWRRMAAAMLGGYAFQTLSRKPLASVSPRAMRLDAMGLVCTQLILIGVISYTMHFWVYLFLWAAPLVTITLTLHLVRSFCEHALTDEERDPLSAPMVSVHANWLEAFVFSPYNLQYHAEHHLFPGIPGPRLPQVRRWMAQHGDLPRVVVRDGYLSAVQRYLEGT